MSEFSNSFFRDLPPRERRYDVPVGDQLVFCVFPNGVKTWVHVYPFEEFTRRRTIGLYPDMRFEQVHDALDASRWIVELDSDHERRRVQEVRRSRGLRNFGMTAVAAAAGVTVSVLVARGLQGEVGVPLPSKSVPSISAPTISETSVSVPVPVATHRDPDQAVVQSDTAAISESVTTQTTSEDTNRDLVLAQTTVAGSTDEQAPLDEPDPTESLDVGGADVDQQTTDTVETPVPVVESDEPANSESDEDQYATDETGADDGDEQPEPHTGQTAEPETVVVPPAQIVSGQVRRALLADSISAHEPANVLQSPIGIDADNIRTIFFFTELRGLGGERVSHHWKHLGNTIAEVPFDVRADGRWRVYSSKRIAADQSGSWTVEVVSSDGVVLSTVAFEVENNPAN